MKENRELSAALAKNSGLLQELLEGRRKDTDLSLSIADLTLWLSKQNQADPNNAKLKEIADRVEKLFDKAKAGLVKEDLPKVVEDALTRTEVDIALGQGKFERALELATAEKLQLLRNGGPERQNEYVTMLKQRADAFRGLQRWEDAIQMYGELLDVRPMDTIGVVCLSAAYVSIGQKEIGRKACRAVVDYYRDSPINRVRSFETRDKLIEIKHLLALIDSGMDLPDEVKQECTDAIRLTKELRDNTEPATAIRRIAAIHNMVDCYILRGMAFCQQDKLADGIADYTEACDLFKLIDQKPEVTKFRHGGNFDYAYALHQRAKAFRKQKSAADCLIDYGNAILELKKKPTDGRNESEESRQSRLAGVFSDLGYALYCFDRHTEAVQAYAKCFETSNPLFEAGKKNELGTIELALNNLDLIANSDTDEKVAAFNCVDRFVAEIDEALVAKKGVLDLSIIYHAHRGALYKRLGKRADADADRRVCESRLKELEKMGPKGLFETISGYASRKFSNE